MQKQSNATNDLRHRIDQNDKRGNYQIEIRLNDECRNGCEDFAITATFWEIGRQRTDRNMIAGGCCHELILSVRPDLKDFVGLHLCDWEGAPMFGNENGRYFLPDMEQFCRYFRCSPQQREYFLPALNDERYFAYLLQKSPLPGRWKEEADAAIKILEEWTGQKFVSSARKKRSNPLSAKDMKAIAKLEADGYFLPAAVTEREAAAAREAAEKAKVKILQEYEKAALKARTERDVKILIVESVPLPCKNFIYYGHSNTVAFNWLEYERKVPDGDIERIKGLLQNLECPPDVKNEGKGR